MNYLTLVNKSNLIKDNYFKHLELVDYKNILNKDIKVEKNTLESFLKLKSFLETKNIYIDINTSYRSFLEQQKEIDKYYSRHGASYVEKYVAPVKASEHHTALAIDICLKVNDNIIFEDENLHDYEEIFSVIHKFLKDYGFILRYPKNKEKVTGYNYEPWHIRYVGVVPATIIYNNNLTLEEYLSDFSGVLVINKDKDMTSFDVVNKISKILGIKRIGHTGTLDPMAEGVLVLTIGKATRISELLTSYSKEYIAGVEMGILTDTLDTTGTIISKKEIDKEIDLESLCKSFEKKYLQEVPIYSAVKVNGKKLYEYARNGENIELPKKEVDIKKIELLEKTKNTFKFKTLVSKGTYIRSLIRDMGLEVGEYFCMSSLIRTKQGDISIEDAYTIKDVYNNKFEIKSMEDALSKYKIISIDKEMYNKIKNGCKISDLKIDDNIVLFTYEGRLVGIYKNEREYLKAWKIFA